jgi:hypothetical protein
MIYFFSFKNCDAIGTSILIDANFFFFYEEIKRKSRSNKSLNLQEHAI